MSGTWMTLQNWLGLLSIRGSHTSHHSWLWTTSDHLHGWQGIRIFLYVRIGKPSAMADLPVTCFHYDTSLTVHPLVLHPTPILPSSRVRRQLTQNTFPLFPSYYFLPYLKTLISYRLSLNYPLSTSFPLPLIWCFSRLAATSTQK